ncbi:MAG TPA: SigE family RNA polymerase sigma factor [Actinospica sp.]|jgi:RNA polymerase sigma-70 factor (sigma-E family)|nr:SigE family RNA polymerase sigma factor [Actinospica sp.]
MDGGSGGERRRPHGTDSEFAAFFAAHYNELARFAYLLIGEHAAADDVAAEALAEAWKGWARVSTADRPLAYVRRIAANIAANRTDRVVRERRSWRLWSGGRSEQAPHPDSDASVDLQTALLRLPARKRACVVLRYYYDLSERETASTLGISVGTVKSQSSRGLEELAAQLRGSRTASAAANGGRRRSATEGANR